MTNAYYSTETTGAQSQFSIPFPYLDRSHVVVELAAVTLTLGVDYTFVNDTLLEFTSNPTGTLVIKRVTPAATPLVDFVDGSVLTEADLDTAFLQALYVSQETQDTATVDVDEVKAYVDAAQLYPNPQSVPQAWTGTGDGSTTSFPLSTPTPTTNNEDYFIVAIDGALQFPGVDFSVDTGNNLVFTSPPANLATWTAQNYGVGRTLNEVADASITGAKLHPTISITASNGNTARQLVAQVSEVHNVLDYGADDTGVADSAAEIQAAIDACEAAGGGVVYFPAGVYQVSASGLTVDSDDVKLMGQGRRASTISLVGQSLTFDATLASKASCSIERLSVARSGVAGSAVHLSGDEGSGHTVEDFVMTEVEVISTGVCLELTGVKDLSLRACIFDGGTYGIQAADSTDVPVNGLGMTDCVIDGCAIGMELEGAKNVTIHGGAIKNPTNEAIRIVDRCVAVNVNGTSITSSAGTDPLIRAGVTGLGAPTNSSLLLLDGINYNDDGGLRTYAVELSRIEGVTVRSCRSFGGGLTHQLNNNPEVANSVSGDAAGIITPSHAAINNADSNFGLVAGNPFEELCLSLKAAIFTAGTTINDAATATDSVTVTGAEIGDWALASLGNTSFLFAGCNITAYVKAAGTVEVHIHNRSGGNITIPPGGVTARFLVIPARTFLP